MLAIEEEHQRPRPGGASRGGEEGQGLRPEGQTKEWLRSYDFDKETLDAGDAAQWLGVRQQEGRRTADATAE